MKNKINKQKGYTIIETMIAVSLFLVIVTIGMGALLNANLLHNKSQDMRSIMDNLSFIMEDMSKNLRTGYNYRCIDAPSDFNDANVSIAESGVDCWGIAFEFATGDPTNNTDQWVYQISNDTHIYRATTGPYTSSSNFLQLTPDEIVINTTASKFSILGAEAPSATPSNKQQPLVTIRLVGDITYKGVKTPFSLQTSVSQRAIDI
ncbi:prepilin-type N-terminal cleavage/methylation domain-containing protein [Candidatus Nomurabacteria bacterium]|nr:prepilin-type N-terminal cleavage/methylation domain-containing protein [Candidatus Nomurabacteria bacterium]